MNTDQNPLPTSARFLAALNYATTLHTESRKDTTIPYISHLYSVAALVMESNGSEEEVIAALLHDAVEDHGGVKTLEKIRSDYGEEVAAIVDGCTDDAPPEGQEKRPWRERKEEYVAHIASASKSVRLVSNADKLHNARCILRDYREIKEKIWDRFTGKKEGSLWYYRALADAFLSNPANTFLAEELNRVVSELESG
jgi:(p)ppGpp synthase/HD superfamily hydrolase